MHMCFKHTILHIYNMNVKPTQLITTSGYVLSAFIQELTPQETDLLLTYGESLLREHKFLVNTTALDETTAKFARELAAVESKMANQMKSHTEATEAAHSETRSLETKYSICEESLKREMQVMREMRESHLDEINRVKINYNLMLKQEISIYTESLESACKRVGDENKMLYETEIHNIRNKHKNESEAEYHRCQSVLQQERDRNNILIKNMNEMQDMHLKAADAERNTIRTELEVVYTKLIADMQSRIGELQDANQIDLDRMQEQHEVQLKILTSQITMMNNASVDREKFLCNVEKIVKYYEFENTSDKGSKGECRVREIIKDYYKNSVINDTSGVAHAGDMRLSIPDTNFVCLIEVKNKKYVTEDDVLKFLNDVETNKKEVTCGLFVSILSENIPTKGSFHIEIKNALPIIYVYIFDNSTIQFAINTLMFLTEKFSKLSKKSRNNEQISEETISLIYGTFNTMKSECDRLDMIIKNLEKQTSQIKITKKNLISKVDLTKEFYNKYTAMEPLENKEVKIEVTEYTDTELTKVKAWVAINKKIPKRDEIATILEITTYEIMKRGTSKLQKILRNSFEK